MHLGALQGILAGIREKMQAIVIADEAARMKRKERILRMKQVEQQARR